MLVIATSNVLGTRLKRAARAVRVRHVIAFVPRSYCIDRLNVYWSGVQPPAPPITVPSIGLWQSLGCYMCVS